TSGWIDQRGYVEFTVSVRSMDAGPQASEGTLRIHKLIPPPKVMRARLWGEHDYLELALAAQAFNQTASDMSNLENWPSGSVVSEQLVATETNGLAKFSI